MGILHNIWRPVQSAYLRITFSRLTLAFFIFSTVYCIAQGVIQSFLINTDLGADNLVTAILHEAQVPLVNLPWLTKHGDHVSLKVCSQIPGTTSYDSCVTVYDSAEFNANWTTPVGFRRADVSFKDKILLTKSKGTANSGTILNAFHNSTGVITGVHMLSKDGQAFLSEQCTRALLYPHQIMRNSKREEIVLLVGQFWFFGISLSVLVFDSIPHILALICMRILETTWSSYTIWRTHDIRHTFQILLANDSSPCEVDLFPHYFSTRISFQIPDLILNITGLLCTLYLGWHLIKLYNVQTFKRVGPPEKVIRIYRFFMTLAVALHVSLFLMTASVGIWVDTLMSEAIAAISTHTPIYMASFIFTVVTLAPWCFMGSYSVRREHKPLMSIFLAVCFIYISSWSIMFYSQVYRWTWLQWPFFASMTVASFVILIIGGSIAVICLLNFNKGLAHYRTFSHRIIDRIVPGAPSTIVAFLIGFSIVHVEGVLAQSDFQPEFFFNNNDVETAGRLSSDLRRNVSYKSTKSADTVDFHPGVGGLSRSLSIKKDSNWDFNGSDGAGPDTNRPAIYVVELDSESSFKVLPSPNPKSP